MAPTRSVFASVGTVLAELIQSIQGSGSQITDFSNGSVMRTVGEAFATAVSNRTATADQLQLDSYLDTATGSALDALGTNNWQVPRLPGVQATGTVTITRDDTTGAMLIPAGFAQLVASPSVPGGIGAPVLTTQDASFAAGVATVTVTAQAAIGGLAGNISAGTFLTPAATVNGVSSTSGFVVATSFTNGLDAESDDAYRARIPIVVQGRVKGQTISFQAAALSVPGVLSVGVLPAGSLRGDGSTVPAGSVEVYYQGSVGLLAQVDSAVEGASVVNQNAQAFASVSLAAPRGPQRVVVAVGVYVLSGADPTAIGAAVSTALQTYVNGRGIANTVYLSQAVEAIFGVTGVISVTVPLAQFSKFGVGGAADITVPPDSYASLAAADVTVVVNTL